MKHKYLATIFMLGNIEFSASIASVVGIILSFLFQDQHIIYLCIATILSICATSTYLKKTNQSDPKEIIIDEVIGASYCFLLTTPTITSMFISLILFRILDIFKPFPINIIDKKTKGAFGVVIDDIVAGIFVSLIIKIIL